MSEKINDGVTAHEGLPEGCPTEAVWANGILYREIHPLWASMGWNLVEINPVGTRSALSALEARCGELEAGCVEMANQNIRLHGEYREIIREAIDAVGRAQFAFRDDDARREKCKALAKKWEDFLGRALSSNSRKEGEP